MAVEQAPENIKSVDPAALYRRNFLYGVLNGSLFMWGFALFNPSTILSVLLLELLGSKLIVGMLTTLLSAGWLIPQLLVSGYVLNKPRKMAFYRVNTVFRTLSLASLPVVIGSLGGTNPKLAGYLILVSLFVYALTNGLSGVPFMDIVSKIMPPDKRGRFFATRMLLGNLLAFGSGFAIQRVLDSPTLGFPLNYVVLTGLGVSLVAAGWASFCMVEEPPGPVTGHSATLLFSFAHGVRTFRRDEDLRRLWAVTIFWSLSAMGLPFFATMAVEVFGATAGFAGIMTGVAALSAALSNLFWAPMSEFRGDRRLWVTSSIGMVGVTTMSVLLGMLPRLQVHPSPGWEAHLAGLFGLGGGVVDLRLPLLLLMVAIAAFVTSGQALGGATYLLNLAPQRARPTYVGFFNTLIAPLAIISTLAGGLVDLFSYELVFGLSFFFSILAVIAAHRLREVREDLLE